MSTAQNICFYVALFHTVAFVIFLIHPRENMEKYKAEGSDSSVILIKAIIMLTLYYGAFA